MLSNTASLHFIPMHCIFSKTGKIILFHHICLHRFLGGDACTYCYITELKQSNTLLRSLLKAQMSVQFCGLEYVYSGTSSQGTPSGPRQVSAEWRWAGVCNN